MAETDFSLVRYKGNENKAKEVYRGLEALSAEDIAETMLWLAERPAHICVDELVIKPTAQAAPHKVFRK
jgi:NADP-dependent 3-hydroxy acid dehydrogenase YdfG